MADATAGRLRPPIRTPDQRLRVFISSTLQELADERAAARDAVARLRLHPVLFELGARPHPPKDLYRAYLDQSHVFVGIYWQRYGWVAPDMEISGLEDEYRLSANKPKLIYIKTPAPDREPRLKELLDRIKADDDTSYKSFRGTDELRDLLENDLALLQSEYFEIAHPAPPSAEEPEDLPANNLPRPVTRLVGRDQELLSLRDLLQRGEPRLVTLTGPGGVGKTRLGLQAALDSLPDFPDGAFLVPLASIRDPDLVVPAIATTLAVPPPTGGRTVLKAVQERLRGKRCLLILDNFEHLRGAAPIVVELLEACPRIRVLVTSRVPLHVRGEREFPVPPLALPERDRPADPERLSQYAAVALFIQRALDVQPSFAVTNDNAPAVAEICHRLDGLPLAIELAAARSKILPPRALLARLDRRLATLKGGALDLPARQQTLRGAIDWSHDLLDPKARVLFRRLAVFVAGWDMEAAEAVCNPENEIGPDLLEAIESLVDNSLLHPAHDAVGGLRFGMLETIREYAFDRLSEAGEADRIQGRHADHYQTIAGAAEPGLDGPQQGEWLSRIQADLGNVRAALRRRIDQGESERAILLAASLWRFWEARGLWKEGRGWIEAGLRGTGSVSESVRAHGMNRAGWFAYQEGMLPEAEEMLRAALEIQRRLGEEARIAQSLSNLGPVLLSQGKWDEARGRLEESLAIRRAQGDKGSLAATLMNLGIAVQSAGDAERAEEHYVECLSLLRSIGDDVQVAKALLNLANIHRNRGELDRALSLYEEGISLTRKLGDATGTAYVLGNLGWLNLQRGELRVAEGQLLEAIGFFHEAGDRAVEAECLRLVGRAAHLGGRHARAACLWAAADRIFERIGWGFPKDSRPAHDLDVAAARAALGDAAFENASAEGRAMDEDQAVAYANAGREGPPA